MTIKKDRKNYRVHSEENLNAIEKSLRDCGAGRSILIDNDNEIIAGNGCFQQAEKLGIPIKVIETDGSELIALKRTDLSYEDQRRTQLAVMDNATSDLSEFDVDSMLDDFSYDTLVNFGVITKEFDEDAQETAADVDELVEDDVSEDNSKLEKFLEAKQHATERGKDILESNFWLCLVFQSYEQKIEFLSKIGDPETRYRIYADGQTIAKALGVEITPNTQKPLIVRTEKKLEELAME